MTDDLIRRWIVVVDFCCLCKLSMETMDNCLVHCNIAKYLPSFCALLFRVIWTMPRTVFNFWHAGYDSLEDTAVVRYGRLLLDMFSGVFGESKNAGNFEGWEM